MLNRLINHFFNGARNHAASNKHKPVPANHPNKTIPSKSSFSSRLKKINDDETYVLRNLSFPQHFCDSLEYEFMDDPIIIDRAGHSLNKSQLKQFPNLINPFTNVKMILIPDDFNFAEYALKLDAFKFDLENHSHPIEQQKMLKEQIALTEDYIIVYELQSQIKEQLEQFVLSQEKIYDLIKQQGPFEERINQLKTQLKLEKYANSTIEALVDEQRKIALLEALKNFIETTAEIIYFHSAGTSEIEKKDEIKKVLKEPRKLYKSILAEIEAHQEQARQNNVQSQTELRNEREDRAQLDPGANEPLSNENLLNHFNFSQLRGMSSVNTVFPTWTRGLHQFGMFPSPAPSVNTEIVQASNITRLPRPGMRLSVDDTVD